MEKYYLFTWTFWKAALHRALRTFFQAIAGCSVVGVVILDVDWKFIILSAITSSLFSIATSAATGLPEVEEEE